MYIRGFRVYRATSEMSHRFQQTAPCLHSFLIALLREPFPRESVLKNHEESAMGSNLVSNTISVLAGASLGAIATYLLDPDQGDSRRHQISKTAEDAVSTATDAVTSHLHRAIDAARDAAGTATQYAGDAAGHVADHFAPAVNEANRQAKMASSHAQSIKSDLIDRVNSAKNDWLDRANSTKSDWTDRAHSAYGNAKKAAMRQAGVQESHPVEALLGHTIGTIGIAAIGAGAMYLMDPAKGRARRAWVTDKAFSWTRKAGTSARSYGRHLGNQLQGVSHDLQQAVPQQWSNVTDRASDMVSQAKEKVQPMVQQAKEKMQPMVDQAKDKIQPLVDRVTESAK
jgi:gas vesicle protein